MNSTHPEYDASLPAWLRARDVLAGEDAVKSGTIRYVPRLDSQTDDEYAAYLARGSFFNATARTADGYVGLVCRRPPFIKVPDQQGAGSKEQGAKGTVSTLGKAMAQFVNDADMLGTPLGGYGQGIVSEVIAVGRAGTLVDWEGEVENRVYVSRYAAEDILNWRTERINGRNLLTLLVLREKAEGPESGFPNQNEEADEFETKTVEQIRVLRLVDGCTSPQPHCH